MAIFLDWKGTVCGSFFVLSAQNVPAPCSRYSHPVVTRSPRANLTVWRLTPNSFISSLSELIFWFGLYVPSNIFDLIDCFTVLYFVFMPTPQLTFSTSFLLNYTYIFPPHHNMLRFLRLFFK